MFKFGLSYCIYSLFFFLFQFMMCLFCYLNWLAAEIHATPHYNFAFSLVLFTLDIELN